MLASILTLSTCAIVSTLAANTKSPTLLADLALEQVLSAASPILGFYEPNVTTTNTSTWMKKYPDSTMLVHMNIPGTHVSQFMRLRSYGFMILLSACALLLNTTENLKRSGQLDLELLASHARRTPTYYEPRRCYTVSRPSLPVPRAFLLRHAQRRHTCLRHTIFI